jgi:hypothetical protein
MKSSEELFQRQNDIFADVTAFFVDICKKTRYDIDIKMISETRRKYYEDGK